jgi:LPXTG-motif cell wall-anchored protein
VDNKPDNIAEALGVLALMPGDPLYVSSTHAVVPQIAFYDAVAPNPDSGPPMPDPTTDPRFAVMFSGYLNVTVPGTYNFRAYTDDGFRFLLGGENVMQFDDNRAPGSSFATANLVAGLYPISFLGWEQGGAFVNELAWALGTDNPAVIPQANLFSRRPSTGVPDGGSTLLLLGLSLALGGAVVRRARQ